MARVFSHTYHASIQQQFLETIGERRYQEALQLLDSFPQPDPSSVQEKLIRERVISEGYRFLANSMLQTYRPERVEKIHSRMLELRGFRAIGNPNKGVAEVESLSDEVSAYREIGTPEELEADKKNLEHLEDLIEGRI